MTGKLISDRQGPEPRRFPGWIVPILAVTVGWFVKGPLGALLGLILGVLIWRSRA